MELKLKAKNRSVNFTPREETLLANLVKKYKHILENKKTDAITNKEKNKYWLVVEKEFNAESGASYRSAQILKKKYENMKKQSKKKISEEKCYKFGTGGGPFQDFTLTKADETVIEILGETRVHGMPTQFGGDAEPHKHLKTGLSNVHTICSPTLNDNFEDTQEIEEEILIYTDEFEDDPETMQNTDTVNHEIDYIEDPEDNGQHEEVILENVKENTLETVRESVSDIHKAPVETWSKYNPALLKTPKSKALKPSAKRNQNVENPVAKKISQWASTKSSLEEEKRQYLEEEHKTKLRLLKERHDVEISLMKRESQVKITRSEEEKKIVIECLKQEQKYKKEIFELQKLQILQEIRK